MNYHCQLEEHPIGDVKPMKLVVQYLTQAAVKLPGAGDHTRAAAFNTRCSLSMTVLGDCPWCTSKNSVAVIDP